MNAIEETRSFHHRGLSRYDASGLSEGRSMQRHSLLVTRQVLGVGVGVSDKVGERHQE